MTLEQHQLILDLVANGESPEAIASRLGRSVAAIKRVAEEHAPRLIPTVQLDECGGQTVVELDDVLDFLSSLPEEGLEEMCQLASLQRQSWQLRAQLLARLQFSV